MSDEDFAKLGIGTLGARLKIKQACKNFVKGERKQQIRPK